MSGTQAAIKVRSLAWVRERVAYSAEVVCELFGVPLSEKISLIADLLNKRIIGRCGMDDAPAGEDAEPLEGYITGVDYFFCFVGVYCRDEHMVCSLPKYANAESLRIPEQGDFSRPWPAARRALFSRVLKAIHRYKHSQHRELPEWQQTSTDSNLLSLMVSLLCDYVENGVYRDVHNVDALNERGRVLWQASIHKTRAVLQQGTPVYPDVVTRRSKFEHQHPITLLHKHVAAICFRCLRDLGLIDLFGLPELDSEESLLAYQTDDSAYMLYLVESELNVQFDSRRRYILMLLREYLLKQSAANAEACTEYAFGCSSFNLLWEDACRCVFGHDYSRLWTIRPPEWKFANRIAVAIKSLEPDVIIRDESATYILDAKYYLPIDSGNGMPSGLPGSASVTKQFLYQQALLNSQAVEIKKGHISPPIYNAFVMPLAQCSETAGKHVAYYATVTMPLFDSLKIIVLCVSPDRLFSCYTEYSDTQYLRDAVLTCIRGQSEDSV
ncbi:MAG: LlaJI family restriction endonuclease [Akkermansia sp.]|nr:LlaJI family restriction endonuclease [Akkermansia sp.]